MHLIRKLSGGKVKCFCLQSATVSAMMVCAPEEYGGIGDFSAKIEAATATAKDEAEKNAIIDKV